ncbi:GumC family protein [Thiosulfativibrio zosterae]|uniref:non-specific protein-tyrosine kinase n=1 Tax=Thiosulfativibrio zosterae TaxID=2675053 RepID=A0A6F8PR19_9GAMM|nr:polysaccharide biosynthesis tyrosine autokinase [Thiosulfativibrio zosterae]BBP44484.1 chain-length determining protein [Thiosulfativibrio zosterae]
MDHTSQIQNNNNLPTQINHNASNNSDVIDLLPLFQTVWRRKWSIVTIVFIVMLLTTLVVMSIIPTYRASTTMQIEQQEAKVVSIEQVYGIDNSSEYLQTQFELLKSRALAEKVVKLLNLTKHKEFDPAQQKPPLIDIKGSIRSLQLSQMLPGLVPESFDNPAPPTEEEILDSVVKAFMERISIQPIKKSQLVIINVDMQDAKMATKAANMLGETFINSQLDASMEATFTASKWMNSRLSELRETLQASENKLQAFKDQEGLIDVDGGITSVSTNELTAINQRLVDARSKRAEAESQYRQVKGIKKDDWQKLAAIPAVLSHPLIQTFKTEEARAKAKVNELSKRYGQSHPSMQTALSDLNAAQASLKAQVLQIVAGIETQYQIAAANEYSLNKSVKENKQQIKDISKNEFKLRELQREVDSNRAIFDTFMTRLKETTATSDLQTTNARIVDPAVIPTEPIKPKKGLIIIIAGFLAGLFAVFLTLLSNALNNTFKSADEIESKLNIPVLGVLPLIKNIKKDQKIALSFHKNIDKIFSECVRTVRTSVMLSSIDTTHKVVIVTSSIPGEGKSTTSINLADAIGQLEKTLLIEADMRRPTMSKILGLQPGTPGLANLIAGSNSIEECIKSLYGGMDIIVAGIVPPNPLELLSSERFKDLIDELSETYERIIIDCPPVQAVSDAIVLSGFADSVIYVIKSDSTNKQTVMHGVGKLLQNKAPIRGIILNQVDIKKAKQQGYSYEGYYDYYGYSSDNAKAT